MEGHSVEYQEAFAAGIQHQQKMERMHERFGYRDLMWFMAVNDLNPDDTLMMLMTYMAEVELSFIEPWDKED